MESQAVFKPKLKPKFFFSIATQEPHGQVPSGAAVEEGEGAARAQGRRLSCAVWVPAFFHGLRQESCAAG